MPSDFLKLSPRISLLPIVHGSGDFAVEVRRVMLNESFDCLAVPLPASFQRDVEEAITHLPAISLVIQPEAANYGAQDFLPSQREYSPDANDDEDDFDDDIPSCSYVPIDPCQGVIAGLRIALGEHVPREFIDLETRSFISLPSVMPDPYALKQTSVDRFAAAVLPSIPPPFEGQPEDRVRYMAHRLRELETRYQSILFICSLTDWPWIQEAYHEQPTETIEHEEVEPTEIFQVEQRSLLFMLGELPFITGLYEKARAELDDDENLSVDGVKEMLLATRDCYKADLKSLARSITPQMLSIYFRYVRNLSLIERRMTPDLYTLVVAARQIAGDQFAIKLAETAREYPFQRTLPYEQITVGTEGARLPDGEITDMHNRLPGNFLEWRTCELTPLPPKADRRKWQMQWNPFRQCSWPPEDVAIEKFRTHVKDQALAMLGNDLARSEKFNTSLKDGLDIRETLRNWHTGDLYVKVLPPTQGTLDCVVMLFDSPADPRDYPWRITWHAEHHDESTLALFATDFRDNLVGPGIAMATYGGAMFLFPPRNVIDIWQDPRFDFADTLEERLLAAACVYSREKHVALVSPGPPGVGWKLLARRFGKKFVRIPLSRFSQETIQQLRMFHVLNGQQVRSYAANFIRRA